MKFRKKAASNKTETRQTTPTVKEIVDFFKRNILTLLKFLKSFAIEVKEINTDHYYKTIDELSEHLKMQGSLKQVELHFEHQKKHIVDFIKRQQAYLKDRETELRDIIDLLTKAMANLNVENMQFYQRVYDQSEKIEKITHLDDIKKIKIALQHEVEQMREIVELKQTQDHHQIDQLAKQVDHLRQELEDTKAKSMSDGLTGAYNRQAFDDYLLERCANSKSMGGFSLMLLDIDNFKAINDDFGHLIGDRVLVAFAQKCQNAIRNEDFLARYGGEEFAIILNGASLRNAVKKAGQICRNVASARYATDGAQTNSYLSMTVSIGVTSFKKGDNPETMVARADKALYKAKRTGKNRAISKK